MELIRNFKELNKNDAPIAGGKGASLGEMTQAGIPVPSGFVILSSTFDQFIKDADLIQEIEALLEKVNHKEIHTVENASEQIQGLIKTAVMPKNIADEIEKQFKNLNAEYVAVRSSATAEDGQEHAWAGQLDSFLNTTEKDLLEKVQHCWASLFTPRAIFYRFEKGLYATQISVAVAVQKMVNSEISGIAFSVHPVTEDRNQLIIEAGFGLGEAIVSGQITPDSYVVEKEPRRIIDKNVNTQARALFRVHGGGNEWRDILEPQASSQVLNDAQISELSKIIIGIENHYGFPCDIEWAYEDGKFYIVQSRPITTLADKSVRTSRQNYIVKKFEGRNSLFSIQSFYSAGEVFNEMVGEKLILSSGHYHKDSFCIWLGNENDYIRARKWFIEKIRIDHKYGDDFYNRCYNGLTEFINSNMHVKWPDQLRDDELIEATKKFIRDSANIIAPAYFTDWYAYEADKWIRDFVDVSQLSDDQFKFLTSNNLISFSKEYEYLLAKIKLGTSDKTVNDIFDDNYWIRDNYAHTGVLTVEVIKKELDQMTEENAAEIVRYVEHNQLLSNKEKIKLQKELGLNEFNKSLLQTLSKFVDLQDKRKAAVFITNYIANKALEKILDEKGIKDKRERDLILNSAMPWWISDLNTEDLIKKSKLARSGFLKIVYSEEVFADDADKQFSEITGTVDGDVAELEGYVASAGFAKGVVKVINKINDFSKFIEGDILVSSMTRPEMVPIMKKAAAFVTDEGGITCHAAIVAREMNKPCIIGTKIATQVLKDGDLVEVDADNGVVRKIEKAEIDNPVQKFISLMAGRKLWPPLNNYTFFGQGSAFNTAKYFGDYYPNLPPLHLILIAKEGESMQVLPSDTLEYCSRYIFRLYLDGSKEAANRFHNFDEVEKYVSSMYEEYNSQKVSETPTDELLKTMDSIRDRIWHLNCYIMFTLYFDKEICLDVLKSANSSISDERLNFIWERATHPAVESFEKAQQRSILKTIAENRSRKYRTEYARFIFTNYFGAEKLEEVAKKVDSEYGTFTKDQARLKLVELDNELGEEETKLNDWLQTLSEDEQSLVWYLQRIIEYRDRRKNLFAKAYVIWWLIYEKVLLEAGIDPSMIIYIQFDEMMRGVEYLKSHRAEIEARKNGAVLLIEFDGTITIKPIDYDKAKQQLTDFYVQSTAAEQKENEIKGQVGSPGKEKGTVRIVLNAGKVEHFKDGDILVTGMTRPEFVPLMKRARAVITDEGGITCHAAIVSRELKIPCIIGTKIATQVLKDGDLVEVDANNGIIKVIK